MNRYSAKEIDAIVRDLHNLHGKDMDTLARAGIEKELWGTIVIVIAISGPKTEKFIKEDLKTTQKRYPALAAQIRKAKGYSDQGRRLPKRIPSGSIDFLLGDLVEVRNPAFNKWKPLERLLKDICAFRGWSDKHITEDMLRKRWKRLKEEGDGSRDATSSISGADAEAIAARASNA